MLRRAAEGKGPGREEEAATGEEISTRGGGDQITLKSLLRRRPPLSAPHTRVRKQVQLYVSTQYVHLRSAPRAEVVTDCRVTTTKQHIGLICAEEQALVVRSCFLQTVFINFRDSCCQTVCV